MIAEKARLFQDDFALRRIMAATAPDEVKRAGRAVTPYHDDRWAAVRFDRVVAGNLAKFGQDAGLRRYLADTAPAILVEASPTDKIWGTGLARDDPAAGDPLIWPGQNLLGFALVKVRDTLSSMG